MSEKSRPDSPAGVYTRLRVAILEGRLMPNERLIEQDLAQSLGTGRAAIRTALARLEQDGLVHSEPFRGARVRLISEAEAIEILEARAVLEGLVARYAALHATDEHISQLQAIVRRMQERFEMGDLLGMSAINNDLHRTLQQISDHQTAARLINGLQAQNVRHQFRTVLLPGRAEQSLVEHRRLVQAVASGDADAAEAAMREHLGNIAAALRRVAHGEKGALLMER